MNRAKELRAPKINPSSLSALPPRPPRAAVKEDQCTRKALVFPASQPTVLLLLLLLVIIFQCYVHRVQLTEEKHWHR